MATQDEINSFVEEIMPYFDPAPIEDDSVQQSWPRLDRGLSDVQDMTRFQHMKGIFARGGNPYWLRGHGTDAATNEANTLFLTVSTITGTAEATMHGAFHRLRENIELQFPAVSTPTTYYVVLEYDPVRSEDGGDPIEAKVVTALDGSQGKDYLVLWELQRRPSQLLSDATRTRVRPFVAGTVSVNSFAELPDPGTVPFGTIGKVRNDKALFYAYTPIESGSNSGDPFWAPLTDPEWIDRVNSTYAHGGLGHHPGSSRIGTEVVLRGTVRLRSGNAFSTNNNGGDGYWVMTLPSNQVPLYTQAFNSTTSNEPIAGTARVVVYYTGEVKVFVAQQCNYVHLDGVRFFTR